MTGQHELLSINGLTTGYGRTTIVRSLSLTVGPGEAVALLGPNGHGKTTLLSAVSGILKSSSGSVVFDGADITNDSPTAIVRRGLSQIPQGSRLFPLLTVDENLTLASRTARAKAERSETLTLVRDLFPKLVERKNQLVGTLSGGERQMVAIGMGLMARPRLLILDEPTLGLAPKVRSEILTSLRAIRETGLSLLVADGDIDFLFDLTDRWYLVELGRVVGSGTAAERPTDAEVMDMYVGNAHRPDSEPTDRNSPHV
jgi:branched-chain amino acid transport system ATP-binding protein